MLKEQADKYIQWCNVNEKNPNKYESLKEYYNEQDSKD